MGCSQSKKKERLLVPKPAYCPRTAVETGANTACASQGSKSVLKDILECQASQDKLHSQSPSCLLNNSREPEGNVEAEPQTLQAASREAEGLEAVVPLLREPEKEEEGRKGPGGDPGGAEGAEESPPPLSAPAPRKKAEGGCFRWCGDGGLRALRKQLRSCQAMDHSDASAPGEEDVDELEDPRITASRELQACLGDTGLCCLRGEAGLTPEARQKVLEVAEVLKRYPKVGVKVTGHTNPPSHGMTEEDLAELALARARNAKLALKEAGCKNSLAAKAAGWAEGKGARCEVEVCGSWEVCKAEAAAAKLHRKASVRRSVSALPIAFDCGGGRVRTVTFSRRPLGICYDGGTPIRVTRVDARGQAEELGVQEGWAFKAIGGEDVSRREPRDATDLLARLARALPRASR